MKDVTIVEHGGRKYHVGKINDTDVVLVFSRWGKVASATTATSLITEFKIDHLIFTGVAGASTPDLNIGDIVISEQLYQHDMDARPL
ncbi:5'-methylthioadenosine/adenosylhomocysteine nucleosidase, partial [Acinetobacter baumannii]